MEYVPQDVRPLQMNVVPRPGHTQGHGLRPSPEHLVDLRRRDDAGLAEDGRVGHFTFDHSSQKDRWAISASDSTITSRSKRGHQPPSRSTRPAAQPSPTGPPPRNPTAASRDGNGLGQESSQPPISACT